MKNQITNNWAEKLNKIVKDYFIKNFPSYTLVKETEHGPYWGLEYKNDRIMILIGGDIGFNIDIYFDGKKNSLWQFDRAVNNMSETTEENVMKQLDILNRFLK